MFFTSSCATDKGFFLPRSTAAPSTLAPPPTVFVGADATRRSEADARSAAFWSCIAEPERPGDVTPNDRVGDEFVEQILQEHWAAGMPSGVYGKFVFVEKADGEGGKVLGDPQVVDAAWLDAQAPQCSGTTGSTLAPPPDSTCEPAPRPTIVTPPGGGGAAARRGVLAWEAVQCFTQGQFVALPDASGGLQRFARVVGQTKTGFTLVHGGARGETHADVRKTVMLPAPPRPAYAPGTRLCICSGGGAWRDAVVVSADGEAGWGAHTVSAGDGQEALVLAEANHYTAPLRHARYADTKALLMEHLHAASSTVQDAVTMNELRTADQLIKIALAPGAGGEGGDAGRKGSGLGGASDVSGVAERASHAHEAFAEHARSSDCRDARYLVCGVWAPRGGQQPPLLVESAAGSGKTWFTAQLQHALSAPGRGVVPLLVPLQHVAVHLQKQHGFRRRASWFDLHITLELLLDVASQRWPAAQRGDFRDCMLEAFARREVVVILDGIDEASQLAQAVVDFMLTAVVAGGHQLVTTSRPEGLARVREGSLGAFQKVLLLPLSDADQKMVLEQQYDKNPDFFRNLFQFMAEKGTMDRLYAERFPSRDIEAVPDANTHAVQLATNGQPATTGVQLYEAARAAQPAFESLLKSIAGEMGVAVRHVPVFGGSAHEQFKVWEAALPDECLLIAPLKGGGEPNDRVAQKAAEYEDGIAAGKFKEEDSKAGEGMSHVKDINRASIMLRDEARMLAFIGKLRALHASGRLTLARLKNLFRKLGPTHYRRINCSIGVPVAAGGVQQGGVQHLCELQLHQKDIHDNAPDHRVYEYFRKLVKAFSLADFMQNMELLQSIMGVPVMLSLLVVAMETEAETHIPRVPSTKAELYQMVLEKQMQKAVAPAALATLRRTMMWVGAYAHLKTLRLFGKLHVAEALHHDPEAAACWSKLLQVDGTDCLPCYKVLDLHSMEAAYQSRHLSIQEYLCVTLFEEVVLREPAAEALPEQFESFELCQWRGGKEQQAKALREPFNANFFELASSIAGLAESAFPGALVCVSVLVHVHFALVCDCVCACGCARLCSRVVVCACM